MILFPNIIYIMVAVPFNVFSFVGPLWELLQINEWVRFMAVLYLYDFCIIVMKHFDLFVFVWFKSLE